LGHNFDGSAYYVFDYAAGSLASGGGGGLGYFLAVQITIGIITIGAAAAQGLYKAPIYNLLINTWGTGSFGGTTADFITMIINGTISFCVFYPIFKIIFKQEPAEQV